MAVSAEVWISIFATVLAAVTYGAIAALAIKRPGLDDIQHRAFVACFACGFPMLAVVNCQYSHFIYLMLLQAGIPVAIGAGRIVRKGTALID